MGGQLPRLSSESGSRSELPKAGNGQLGSGNRRKVNLRPRPGKTNPRWTITDCSAISRTNASQSWSSNWGTEKTSIADLAMGLLARAGDIGVDVMPPERRGTLPNSPQSV